MSNPIQPLSSGNEAPDFTLKASTDQEITLSALRGRPVILAFYPADWSSTCSDQLSLYQHILPEFEAYDAQLLGISVDGIWCHKAFASDRDLSIPLLSDFYPHGGVSERYGIFNEERGTSARSLFVIDNDGRIAWSYLAPPGVNPGADGILTALEALRRSTGDR